MVTRVIVVLLAALSVAGCGLFSNLNPISNVERQLGVPVTETGRVTVGRNQVIFFRFQKGNQCGTGHASTDGGAAWGAGPCNNPPLALPGSGAGTLPDGTLLVTVRGEVNNPTVVKVTITFADGSQLPAKLGGGMYFAAYIGPNGTRGLPVISSVQGFDKDGKVVEEVTPGGGKRGN